MNDGFKQTPTQEETEYQQGWPVLDALLHSTVWLAPIAAALALIAGIGSMPGEYSWRAFFFPSALLLAVYALWLVWRLQLDRAFFALLANGAVSPAVFDRSLFLLMRRNGKPGGRSLADRWRGTRNLVYRLWAALGGSLACMMAAKLL